MDENNNCLRFEILEGKPSSEFEEYLMKYIRSIYTSRAIIMSKLNEKLYNVHHVEREQKRW